MFDLCVRLKYQREVRVTEIMHIDDDICNIYLFKTSKVSALYRDLNSCSCYKICHQIHVGLIDGRLIRVIVVVGSKKLKTMAKH